MTDKYFAVRVTSWSGNTDYLTYGGLTLEDANRRIDALVAQDEKESHLAALGIGYNYTIEDLDAIVKRHKIVDLDGTARWAKTLANGDITLA